MKLLVEESLNDHKLFSLTIWFSDKKVLFFIYSLHAAIAE